MILPLREIDRAALLCAFRNYLEAHEMQADWETVENADNETLVTALCMMSPYGPAEKQALLEAPDLRSRCRNPDCHIGNSSCPQFR